MLLSKRSIRGPAKWIEKKTHLEHISAEDSGHEEAKEDSKHYVTSKQSKREDTQKRRENPEDIELPRRQAAFKEQ